MFNILYQNDHVLITQTHAGEQFNQWGDELYGEFNMGLHVGDDSERVLNNRMALLTAVSQLTDGKIHQIHWLNQIHSEKVVSASLGIVPSDADALITDKSGVGLSIMTADCAPIALFDDDCHQIACIHAGWQGLTKGIIKNTFDEFRHKNIKAVMGACISQANYEITKTLANDIVQSVTEKHLVDLSFDELYQAIVIDKAHDKCLMDIVQLAKLQLAHLNIELVHNDIACSYDEPSLYSYRQQTHASKSATGRMATMIVKLSV